MQKNIKYNNKMTSGLITMVSAIILIIIQVFFYKNTDVLGLSDIKYKIVWISEFIVNIVIPFIIIVTILFKKILICILTLACRSFVSCIPIVVYAVENHQINKMETGTIIVNLIYTFILILICLKKIYGGGIIVAVIITRIICNILNGNIFRLIYGLENGGVYLLYNITYLIVSELIFILPIVYYNALKTEK